MKQPFLIDLPVFLLFFNRPDVFSKVFEAVSRAKPSKLFLCCDGPRDGNVGDQIHVNQCKQIASKIDWECDVHEFYSKENLGCGKRMATGLDLAFTYVDRLIVIEDDCVPSIDFFLFANEMLEKYKDDERVGMVCAMNHLGKYRENDSSYFFGPACCWGWGTWKRWWNNFDFNLGFLSDKYDLKNVEMNERYLRGATQEAEKRKKILDQTGKLNAWTFQAGVCHALQSQLAIVPSVNLITNIGITADSVHASHNIKRLDHITQKYFNRPTYKMTFPLKHPKYVVYDTQYEKMVQKAFKQSIWTRIERIFRRVVFK